ncbi:unnamed protein product [Sphagnum troendelagicum]
MRELPTELDPSRMPRHVAIIMDVLTVFAFSTENWLRPKTEVNFLMELFERVFDEQLNIMPEMFLFSTDSICTQQDPTAAAAVVGNHANLVGHKTHVSDPSLLVNSQEYHTASSSEVY